MTTFAGLDLSQPRVMGIVNATPDSFSDGGEAYTFEDAVARGRAMLAAGADIIDVGGESTRPGAEPVGLDEELSRVVPVVEALAKDGALVSIDTRHGAVMQAAVDAGVKIINDVTALSGDGSLEVAVKADVAVVLMHMQGEPGTMQAAPTYEDASREVMEYLLDRARACVDAGMRPENVCVDPGIGFGKTVDHNLELIAHLDLYAELGLPVLLGVSRKSFIGAIAEESDPQQRLAGSIAAALAGYERGVRLFRVHDVAETVQALKVWQAIEGADTLGT